MTRFVEREIKIQTSSGVFVCLRVLLYLFFLNITHFCDTSGFLGVTSEAWMIETSKIGLLDM